MGLLFGMNLRIWYITDEGLKRQEFFFEENSSKVAELYLAPDGYFDILYQKSYIKTVGMCQSILLDVLNLHNKIGY